MSNSKPHPIKRLLVANRGEIAARILSSARELGIETCAVYTDNDIGHTYNAGVVIRLSSPAAYLSIPEILKVVNDHNIDAVHPGYGFLSESPDFASALEQGGIAFIGPTPEILSQTGDKLRARLLAVECDVPVLPALTEPTGNAEAVRIFAESAGLPVMVKAVDGGGGRGIRLIRRKEDIESLATRAIQESPSKQVFAEKAAVDGFRHVEVQIIGDGTNVMHLWERECSIQRRYQKIVELAPSTVSDRRLVAPLIEAAVKMAKRVHYTSLGTFEFLLNPSTGEFYFLEVNPRLQVEHTITESICGTDIVKAQLQIAQGLSFDAAGLGELSQDPLKPPGQQAIQLRITAEDPEKDYSLSIGQIQSFHFPSGNGIRIDTALLHGAPAVVSSDFDSVVAKLIVTARTWKDVVSKAERALEDTTITGINTNVPLLRAVIGHPDFETRRCDTQWLEARHAELLQQSRAFSKDKDPLHGMISLDSSKIGSSVASSGTTLFRKDDAWAVTLRPHKSESQTTSQQPHHFQLTKVVRNDFPSAFAADILFTAPGAPSQAYHMDIQSTSTSASATSSQHRQGTRSDPSHILLPISGKLVEFLVDVGDTVKKDDPICVIKQMKMEIEIRSHRSGIVTWVTEAEDEKDVAEGMLAAVVEAERVEAKL